MNKIIITFLFLVGITASSCTQPLKVSYRKMLICQNMNMLQLSTMTLIIFRLN